MLSAQPCNLPKRLRQFYQLYPHQQKALLAVVEEMLAMNRERELSRPAAPPPHLHAVK